MSFLQMTAIGRLGKDPEFKAVNGKEVANFSIAVDVWKKGGKQTQWISCSSWSERTNKVLAEYVTKGSQVMIQGQPSTRSFEGRDGTQVVLEIDLTFGSLTLCGGKPEHLDKVPDRASAPSKTSKSAANSNEIDDDIPF